MRTYLGGFALLVACTALQGAWPMWLRIGGQPPGLVVSAVACIGLVTGAVHGCLAGLVGAILLAGATHVPVGGPFVALMLIGAGAGLLRGTLFAERLLVAVLIATLGAIAAGFVRLVFLPPPEFLVWLRGTFASALLTIIATPPVFWLARLTRAGEPTR